MEDFLLRPSGAPGWMPCGQRGVTPAPNEDDDAAREGTCAAWLAEVCHKDGLVPQMMLGATHENGWVVDQDMVNHIDDYLAILRKRDQGQAEVFMQHPVFPMGGTADHIGWSFDMTKLFITDLKYGYGIVEPTSWQLIAYLFLLLSNVPPENWPKLIILAIYQPRAQHKDGPYRRRVVSIEEVQPELNQMQAQIEAILRGDVDAIPGSACLHCHRSVECVAQTRTTYEIWEVLQRRDFLTPTAQQLGAELDMLTRMKDIFDARFAAVQAEVEAQILSNKAVPGWSIEKNYGKRKFTVDKTTVEMITGTKAGVDKVCTPAELIRRGANEEVVKSITTTPFIGTKLTRTDAKDVAAQFAKAQKG